MTRARRETLHIVLRILSFARPLWLQWSLWWHRQALRQLSRRDPLHDDVNLLVLKVAELERGM